MQWKDIPLNPSRRMLRQFAGLWIVFFLGLAAWHSPSTASLWLAVVACTIGPLGLLEPSALRPVFVAWMVLAFPIGWTVSQVSLGLLYFGVFTPLACWFRLRGRNLLHLRRQPATASYWQCKPQAIDKRSYFQQF